MRRRDKKQGQRATRSLWQDELEKQYPWDHPLSLHQHICKILPSGLLRTGPRNGLLGLGYAIDRGIHSQLVGLAAGHGGGLLDGHTPVPTGCPGFKTGSTFPQLYRHGNSVPTMIRDNGRFARCGCSAETQAWIDLDSSRLRCLRCDTENKKQHHGESQYSFKHKNTSLRLSATLYNNEGRRFVTLSLKILRNFF